MSEKIKIQRIASIGDPATTARKATKNESAAQHNSSQKIDSLSSGPGIPMPTPTESNIEAFFYALDFWFEASNISSDNKKFVTVCATLPPLKLMEPKGIIDAAPSTRKYEYLKYELTKYFADSKQKRVQRVLSDIPLGQRKPSELYNEMKRVSGNSLSETIVFDLWVSRLSTHLQPAIIAARLSNEEKLKITDTVNETMHLQQKNVLEATNATAMHNLTSQVNELTREVKGLAKYNSLEFAGH